MTDPNKPDDRNLDDDWAAAMSEQEGSATPSEEEDPWAAAMAEQAAAEEAGGDEPSAEEASGAEAQPASGSVFQPLEGGQDKTVPRDLEMIMDIPAHRGAAPS